MAILLATIGLAAAFTPPASVSRRAVLSGAGAAVFTALPANAFDLPGLEEFEDPAARRYAAKQPNPSPGSMQSKAFYAVAPLAGAILAPSAVWISIASVLTWTIWKINPPLVSPG